MASNHASLEEAAMSTSTQSDVEDDEGVFFGAHQPQESLLVAHLSKAIPPSPVPLSIAPSSKLRLRKRDSREFLRRRTMLHTSDINALNSPSTSASRPKRYPGGFYEKGTPKPCDSPLDSDAEVSSPSRSSRRMPRSTSSPEAGPNSRCDMTSDFANVGLHDIFTSPVAAKPNCLNRLNLDQATVFAFSTGSIARYDQEDEDQMADSDKENVIPLRTYQSVDLDRLISHDVAPEEECREFWHSGDDDERRAILDIGGLKLSDFFDPEPIDEQTGSNDSYSYRTASEDEDSSHHFSISKSSSWSPEVSTPSSIPQEVAGVCDDLASRVDAAIIQNDTEEAKIYTFHRNGPVEGLEKSPGMKGGHCLDGSMLEDCEGGNTALGSPDAADMWTGGDMEDVSAVRLNCDSSCHEAGSTAKENLASTNQIGQNLLPSSSSLVDNEELDSSFNEGKPSSETSPSSSTTAPSSTRSPGFITTDGSPLPEPRGGFVVIPTSPHHLRGPIRAEMGSPWRALPTIPPPILEMQSSLHPLIGLTTSLTSPSKVERDALIGQTPSSSEDAVLPSVTLSALSPVKNVPKSPASSSAWMARSLARQNTIRAQLDTAFISRLGPPQRASASKLTAGSALSKLCNNHNNPRPPKSLSSQSMQHPRSRLHASNSSSSSQSMSSSTHLQSAPKGTSISAQIAASSERAQGGVVPRPVSVPRSTLESALHLTHAEKINRLGCQSAAVRPENRGLRPPTTLPTKSQLPSGSSFVSTIQPVAGTTGNNGPAKNVSGILPTRRPALGQPSRLVRPDQQMLRRLATSGPARALHDALPSRSPLRSMTNEARDTPLQASKFSSPSRLGTPGRLGTPSRTHKHGTPAKYPASPRPQVDPQPICSTGQSSPNSTGSASGVGNEAASAEQVEENLEHRSCQRPSPRPVPGQAHLSNACLQPVPTGSLGLEAGKASLGDMIGPRMSRPRRIIKEQDASKTTARERTRPMPGYTAPGTSQKELSLATQRNTSKNEVYHCAIERRVIRRDGPRPPSPTSKIRTTADREEAERRAGRNDRASRRSKESDCDVDDLPPAIERVLYSRGPGDEEDWSTPGKAGRKGKSTQGKRVNWDRELVIIRDDGRQEPLPESAGTLASLKSSLKADSQVELDRNGNLVQLGRPKESLKRTKIVVTAIFYDGEDGPGEPLDDKAGKAVKRKSSSK